jgi:hypothetical protein
LIVPNPALHLEGAWPKAVSGAARHL